MKLRHCAALALLAGWYLIAPPFHDHHVVDGAPLSRYLVMGSYDSAADCNIGLSQLLLVNNQVPPPRFLLAADQPDDENTVHGPADVGLPSEEPQGYTPIPQPDQDDYDAAGRLQSDPQFDEEMRAHLEALGLIKHVVSYGPFYHNGKTVFEVGIDVPITVEMKREFDHEMMGVTNGWPIVLKQKPTAYRGGVR